MACSKLHRNAVLTSSLAGSFCLACDKFLDTVNQQQQSHIEKPDHEMYLMECGYVTDFRDDNIRKVRRGYYCEFCNLLISTATKLKMHVANNEHITKKGLQLLKRVSGGVIAFGDILISDVSWHGLIETTCILCSADYDDKNTHISESFHLINLVLSTVKFTANKAVYRIIDDDSFQCMTCNVVLSLNMITEHFKASEHEIMHLKCSNLKGDVKEINKKEIFNSKQIQKIEDQVEKNEAKTDVPIELPTSKISPYQEKLCTINNEKRFISVEDIPKKNRSQSHCEQDNNTNILDSVNNYQKNGIYINFETDSAFCRRCLTALQFDYKIFEEHIEEHKVKNKSDLDALYPQTNRSHCKICLYDDNIDDNTEPTAHNFLEHNIDNNDVKASLDSDEDDEVNEIVDDKSESPMEFAKINNLIYNANKSKAYCNICKVIIPSRLKSMKEHVSGNVHKKCNKGGRPKCERKSQSHKNAQRYTYSSSSSDIKDKPYTTIPAREFIDTIIRYNSSIDALYILDEKICLDILSFMTININARGNLRCHACNEDFSRSKLKYHCDQKRHNRLIKDLPVVSSLISEFVREVRPGVFHCGFCNFVVSTYGELKLHLASTEHQECKCIAQGKLRIRLAEYEDELRKERLKAFFLNTFLSRIFQF